MLLIQLYEANWLLWDSKDMQYKNKFKRQDAMEEISKILETTEDVIKKKLDSLLAQYRREKTLTTTKSGMGADDKKKTWWAFHFFKFLQDKNKPRLTISSLQASSNMPVETATTSVTEEDEQETPAPPTNSNGIVREAAGSVSQSQSTSTTVFLEKKKKPRKDIHSAA